MNTDSRGHALTSTNSTAATACALAMDHYMERKSDVSALLSKSIDSDPECAIAHATMGLMLLGAKNQSRHPLVHKSLKLAKQFSSGITTREKLYIKALEFAVAGQINDCVSCYESILEKAPTDGFALSLCQAELFWQGDMTRSLAASNSVAKYWNESVPGYSEFLGIYAFDLEETGQYDLAERTGRDAVDLNQANIWATHAVAHVLYMQRRNQDGIEWIASLQNNWDNIGQMQFHIWWHRCLFHLECGEHDAVLEGYDNWVRNHNHELVQALPDLYLDLQNGASLLSRLELVGVDIGKRWDELASVVVPRINDLSSPFTSAHFAIILAAVGDFESCDQLIEAMSDFAATSKKNLASHYARAALPAARGAIAHRKGNYQQTVELLYPARKDLILMGGSHAQQDIFYQILVDAAARTGQQEKVATVLDELAQIGFVEPTRMSAYNLITDRNGSRIEL